MPNQQSFWGPPGGIDSKDYVFYMENPNHLKPPYPLESHTLGGVSQNLTDALMFNRTSVENGRTITKAKVGREAEETSRDYTLGFPNGSLDTPALNLARRGGCESNFYQMYLCPTNVCYGHFYVLTNARMDPPVEAEDPITVDDVVELYETTTLHVETRDLYLHLDALVIYTHDLSTGAGTLQAIHACAQNCPGCGDCVDTIYVGGDDGAAAAETSYMSVSIDRGATWTELDLDTLTGGDTSNLIVTSINCMGDYIWITLTDDIDSAVAAVGAIAYSTDGGVTFNCPAAPVVAMFTAFAINGIPYVAGLNGNLWGAADGVNWVQIVSTVLTTEDLLGSAVDEEEGIAYLVGSGGAAVTFDGGVIVDISAALAALAVPPTILYDAHVLEHNRIQVSGATGFIAESGDGGATWTALTVAGTTGDVFALQGDAHRALATVDGNLYGRDIMGNLLGSLLYAQIDYKYSPTLTGDLVGLTPAENHNYFFGVMTTGEVIKIAPCSPDYCAERVQV